MGAKKTTPPSIMSGSGRKSSPSVAPNAISSGTPTGRPPPYKRSSTSPQINEAPPVAHVARQTLVARSVENVTVEEQEEVEDAHDYVENSAKPRRASDSVAIEAAMAANEADSSCILS